MVTTYRRRRRVRRRSRGSVLGRCRRSPPSHGPSSLHRCQANAAAAAADSLHPSPHRPTSTKPPSHVTALNNRIGPRTADWKDETYAGRVSTDERRQITTQCVKRDRQTDRYETDVLHFPPWTSSVSSDNNRMHYVLSVLDLMFSHKGPCTAKDN